MRGKKKDSAFRFLTGGKSSFLNASTLLTAVGVGWGLYETMKPKTTVAGPIGGPSPYQTPPQPGTHDRWQGALTPPPLPGQASEAPPPPPLQAEPSQTDFPADLLRFIRLTISAARADGELSAEERDQILVNAREAGAESVVERELRNPLSLDQILQDPITEQQKRDLYVLAFTIVRADEGVTGAEQIYLAQLAHKLGLDLSTTEALEKQVVTEMTRPSAF